MQEALKQQWKKGFGDLNESKYQTILPVQYVYVIKTAEESKQEQKDTQKLFVLYEYKYIL